MSRARMGAGCVALAITASALTSTALAQDPGSRQTREFIQAAAQSDAFEVMEGTTVLAQSQNLKIRAFAQSMIDVHQRTSANLLQAIAKAGLSPPLPGLSNDQSQFLSALQSQRGADLDRVYVKQQVLAHRAALAVDQAYATSGDDTAIRSVAAAVVPVVIGHLEMIEQMQDASN